MATISEQVKKNFKKIYDIDSREERFIDQLFETVPYGLIDPDDFWVQMILARDFVDDERYLSLARAVLAFIQGASWSALGATTYLAIARTAAIRLATGTAVAAATGPAAPAVEVTAVVFTLAAVVVEGVSEMSREESWNQAFHIAEYVDDLLPRIRTMADVEDPQNRDEINGLQNVASLKSDVLIALEYGCTTQPEVLAQLYAALTVLQSRGITYIQLEQTYGLSRPSDPILHYVRGMLAANIGMSSNVRSAYKLIKNLIKYGIGAEALKATAESLAQEGDLVSNYCAAVLRIICVIIDNIHELLQKLDKFKLRSPIYLGGPVQTTGTPTTQGWDQLIMRQNAEMMLETCANDTYMAVGHIVASFVERNHDQLVEQHLEGGAHNEG